MVDELDIEIDAKEVTPLTDWENEPSLADLKADLLEATSHHDAHTSKVDIWLDNLNVTGSAKIKKVKGRSTLVPKLIRKQAEWRYASLSESFLSHEDLFTTSPVTWEDKKAAIQNGLVLNDQFNNKLDKVAFIDEYVRTAVDEGTVVVRVGWDFEEEEVDVPNMVLKPIEDPQMAQMVIMGMEVAQTTPEALNPDEMPPELLERIELSMEAGYPVEMVQEGMKKEMRTIRNEPTVDVCGYKEVIIDPTCKGNIKKANFVMLAFETNKSTLSKAGNYVNLDSIKTDTNSISNTAETSNIADTHNFNFKDDARKKFIAYEYWGYWDINNTGKTKPFVATWVGDTLIRMEESPFPDQGLPFVSVQYLPKRKNVYGEPDGELLEDNQKIIGAVTRGMVDILGRSAAGQTGIRKDALDVTNQRKFDAGMDYSFNAHVDARSAFFTNVYPEIPNSAQFMLQLQNNDAESLSGIKAFHEGISGEGLGRSATAARSAIDAASKRELGILRRLAKGIVDIGYKVAAMNAIFLSEEEVIRVTNDEFVTVKRDDLAGRIDIKLQISTVEADNAKAEELAFMLQTTGPNSDPAEVRMIRAEIARLRKMPDLAKQIAEYQPEPDPIAEKLRELEVELKMAEIEEIKSKTAENYAQAEEAAAQARLKDSDADMKDLDFVEQESGVTYGRDLEKLGAQGRANQELELTKALLNPKGGNSTN